MRFFIAYALAFVAGFFIIVPAAEALQYSDIAPAVSVTLSGLGKVLGVATGNQWYASPTGSPNGDGSMNNPWDLQTALCGGPHSNLCNNYLKIADTLISTYGGSNAPVVRPGDTIWLLNGTYGSGYATVFYSNIIGTSSSPIYVRQYQGARATVNGGLQVYGDYIWFWGFEVENSNAYRVINSCGTASGSNDNPYIRESFKLYAVGTKLINLVLHDTSNVADQNEASQTEIYGNLLYNTGWDDSTYNGDNCRGHGHSLYIQNDTTGTVKTIENNILYNSFDTNINVYGGAPNIWHLHFLGNTVFNPGMHADRRISNFTIGGGQVWHQDILFDSNVIYQALNTPSIGSSYNDMEPSWSGQQGQDLTLLNNYWIGSPTSIYGTLYLKNWQTINMQNNMFVGPLTTTDGWTLGTITASNNKYYASHPYAGTDLNSFVSASTPLGLNVVVRPNKYDTGRANITVMNWDKRSSVSVDLSAANIPDGTSFEIRDAQNYWGMPVYTGTYHAASPVITLPMPASAASVSPLLGTVDSGDSMPVMPPHTSEEFGAFIVLPQGLVASAPPPSNPPPVNVPVVNSFVAGSSSITAGQSTTLSWSVSGATSVNISGGIGAVNAASGSVTVNPSTTTTYTLSAANSGGTTTSIVTVTVATVVVNPPPPTIPTTTIATTSGLTGLIGSWSFDSGTISGTTVTDTSGNNMNGATHGIVTSTAGKFGSALSFDGSSGYISFTNDAPAALTSSLTLNAWLKTSPSASSQAIISKYDATAAEYGYIFKVTPSGNLGVRFGGNNISGTNEIVDSSGKTVTDGQWHQVAAVITLGQNVSFYIDGQLSSTVSAATVSNSQALALEVGYSAWPPYGGFFAGSIDEVKIYRQILTAANINQLYTSNSLSSGTVTSTTKYPRMVTCTSLEGLSTISSYPTLTVKVISSSAGTVLETETLTADSNHQYTVSFQPSDPQLVGLRISANGYLSRMLSNVDTTVSSGVALSIPQLLAGDFNGDNTINSLDYSQLNGSWLKNGTGDINKDGLVNSLDYAILKNNYGKNGE